MVIILQDLLEILLKLLEKGQEVEVTARCLLFLLEIHHGPILANQVSLFLHMYLERYVYLVLVVGSSSEKSDLDPRPNDLDLEEIFLIRISRDPHKFGLLDPYPN